MLSHLSKWQDLLPPSKRGVWGVVFLLLLLPLFLFLISPLPAHAQETKTKDAPKTEATTPEPKKTKEKTDQSTGTYTSTAIPNYISNLYQFAIYAAAILAVVMIMVGGFLWLTSAGNQSQVGRAREYISSAFIGLLLALGSYLILYTINPQLTILGAGKPLPMPSAVSGVDPNSSCEDLEREGFTVTPQGEKCKTKEAGKYKGLVTNSPPKKVFPGTTCTYDCGQSFVGKKFVYCTAALDPSGPNYNCNQIPLDKETTGFDYCVWGSCDIDGPDIFGEIELNGKCYVNPEGPVCGPFY